MGAPSELGQTNCGPVQVLQELKFDMLAGQPVPAGLGKTHMPVKVLPALSFDMQAAGVQGAQGSPVLQLAIAFRPDATPAQIGRDCHRLHVVLSDKGLRPVDLPNSPISCDSDVQLAFQSVAARGVEMMEPVIAAIHETVRELWSIRACEARIAA